MEEKDLPKGTRAETIIKMKEAQIGFAKNYQPGGKYSKEILEKKEKRGGVN